MKLKTIRRENKRLKDELAAADRRIENLLEEIDVLRHANALVRAQLDDAKRRNATGPLRPNRKKLDKEAVYDIRNAYYGGATQREIADIYSVNPATVSRIVNEVYHR